MTSLPVDSVLHGAGQVPFWALMLVLIPSGVKATKVLCPEDAQALCRQSRKKGSWLAGGKDAAGTAEIRKWLSNSAAAPSLVLHDVSPGKA